jgi:uncharacterized membrane protein YfcA
MVSPASSTTEAHGAPFRYFLPTLYVRRASPVLPRRGAFESLPNSRENSFVNPSAAHILQFILLAIAALVASTLAAVTGFGGAAILLPVLVWLFGIKEAVPILTVAQLIGNGSRVWFNRKVVDFRVVLWFSLGGVPLAIAGGLLFAKAPLSALTRLLGTFLILIVVLRHSRQKEFFRPTLHQFALIGAASSFLSALLGSVGPLMAPLFLAYGLVKGSYIGTEALATVVMHVFKLIAYGASNLLNLHAVTAGLLLGPIMITGSLLGKKIVDALPERVFITLIDATLVIAGILFLVRG